MLLSAIISSALNVVIIISGIILITKSKSPTGKWYGIFMLSSTGGFLVAILKTFLLVPLYPDSIFLKAIIYVIAIAGFRVCPYLYVMANLSYSKLFDQRIERRIAYILLIPIAFLFVVDIFNVDVIHNISVHSNRLFWMTSVLSLIYVAIAYGLCVIPVFRKKNRSRKIIIIIANSLLIPVALYIYNVFPTTRTFWGYIILVFWAYFVIFAVLAIRHRVLGFRIKLDNIENEEVDQLMTQLTDAERKVFGYILVGKTRREIADLEVKSMSTVKSQISSIYKKLGIKDRQELVDKLIDQ